MVERVEIQHTLCGVGENGRGSVVDTRSDVADGFSNIACDGIKSASETAQGAQLSGGQGGGTSLEKRANHVCIRQGV